jgi:regulator of protease activity HflC (stomatin/prohibitin superfamily)
MLTPILLFLIILVLLVIFIISKGLILVHQAEEVVVERLGQYRDIYGPGLHVIVPGLDRTRTIDWKYVKYDPDGTMVVEHVRIDRIDLREQVYDFPRQKVITRDNVVLEINGVLFYQIIETKRVVYEVKNLPDAVEKIVQTSLRNLVGSMTLDETLASRDKVNQELRQYLDINTDKWGVKVNRVDVQEINPPADIQEAMEKEMRAERTRRATITEADGFRESTILRSKGERESMINQAQGERESTALRAEGEAIAVLRMARAEAESIQRIREALKGSNADASQYLVAMRYIEALRDMVDGNENKVVFMPYEASGVLGSLGGIKEIFKDLNISPE